MTIQTLRKQLHYQIDEWPEDILKEVVDFAAFVLARRRYDVDFSEWTEQDWQHFTLDQLFRDGDGEVQYTLDDAQEIYHK